jgi:hypothetical protein
MPDYFLGAGGHRLTMLQLVQEIRNFMLEGPGFRYRITIGSDSQLLNDKSADFVTAIVVHRIGAGGRYFYRRGSISPFHTLRDRIIREVLLSLETATETMKALADANSPDFEFEVHADVGANGPTNAMMSEVVGMIRAYNFAPRVKPDSYAATSVADKYTA